MSIANGYSKYAVSTNYIPFIKISWQKTKDWGKRTPLKRRSESGALDL